MVRQQMLPWILAAALAPALPVVSTAQQDSEWPFTVRIQTSCANALTAEPPPQGASLVVPVGVPVAFRAVPSVPDTTFLWTPGAALCGGKPRSQTWNLPVQARNSSVVVVVFPQAGKYPLTVEATTRDAQQATASVTVLVAGEDATAPDGSYVSPPAPQPPYGGDPGDPFRFSPPQAYGTTPGEASVTVDAPPYLAVNKDDDSNDEYWDIDDRETPVAAEDDLRPVVLVASGGTGGGKVTLAITDKKRCLGGILWQDAKKRSKMDEREWSLQSGEVLIKQFFLEGWLPSDSVGEVKVSASLAPEGGGSASMTATDKTTVFEVDIDIDSDNQDGLNAEFVATEEEDQIEASPTLKRDLCTGLVGSRSERYGKIVFESGFQDADGDGVPDFADGFGLAMADFPAWTNPDPVAVGADVRFVPVQIVLPRPYNPDNTQIEISCATVPASVPRDGEGLAKLVATAPDGTQSPAGYQLKTPGIRLWRCPPADRASGVNVPAGDYVPMGCKIAWNDLSKAPTYYRMATLYLEFVDDRADSTLAGTHRLKVKARQSDCPTTEDEVAFTLAVARLAVDYNRDGQVAFDASDRPNASKPFRFWVNNDHDAVREMDNDGLTTTTVQDDLDDLTKDCADDAILCTRDLEDFTRLHLRVGGIGDLLKSGKIRLGLQWFDVEETPVIKVYRAFAEKGGTIYLSDPYESPTQCSTDYRTKVCIASPNKLFDLPQSVWQGVSQEKPEAYFLFEGASTGNGNLRLVLTSGVGGANMGNPGCLAMDLLDMQDMYQRWTAGEVWEPGVDWSIRPQTQVMEERGGMLMAPEDTGAHEEPTPTLDEEKDFILFVHGWNMAHPDKRAFAETSYKRLWHLGYQGKFGAFFWPTFWNFPGSFHLGHYDASEHIARNSGDALLGLLTSLNRKHPGRVHLVAHSMGNVVASEALHKAPTAVVKNYAASQASVPADAFVLSPSAVWEWPTILQKTTKIIGFRDIPHLPITSTVRTPNLFAYFCPDITSEEFQKEPFPEIGSPYMNPFNGATNCINLYNRRDWALGLWIADQAMKPNRMDFLYPYGYGWADEKWAFWRHTPNPKASECISSNARIQEILSFIIQAQSYPVGRQAEMKGPFTGKEVCCDTFGDMHPGHSAQFLFSIAEVWQYWRRLLGESGIRHLQHP